MFAELPNHSLLLTTLWTKFIKIIQETVFRESFKAAIPETWWSSLSRLSPQFMMPSRFRKRPESSSCDACYVPKICGLSRFREPWFCHLETWPGFLALCFVNKTYLTLFCECLHSLDCQTFGLWQTLLLFFLAPEQNQKRWTTVTLDDHSETSSVFKLNSSRVISQNTFVWKSRTHVTI